MTEINNSEKEQIISEILSSAEFKDSQRYQDLLKYLVEKTEEEGSVKEIEIAIDVFGKDSSFDPNSNPLIRSYISNLRKKLEHYYLTTENKYTYRIEIPKGQYLINYIYSEKTEELKKEVRYNKYIYLTIILFLLFLLAFQQFRKPVGIKDAKQYSSTPNPIWTDFFQTNTHPTLIVLGDYFFMAEKDQGKDRIFLRNTKINSDKDFQAYLKEYPHSYNQYEPLKFTYLRPSSSFGLIDILNVIGTSKQNTSIKLASQLKWEDFEKHNIIFIGTFKTLYKLDTLIAQTDLRYSVEPSSLEIIGDQKDSTKTFKVSWIASNYQSDYSVLLKISGSKDNTIIFCLGFSEMGVMDAVRSAVDPNFNIRIKNDINKNIPQSSLYFEMISQVEGIELTSFKSQIKYFSFISSSKNNF
jgi:hypothetical protein